MCSSLALELWRREVCPYMGRPDRQWIGERAMPPRGWGTVFGNLVLERIV